MGFGEGCALTAGKGPGEGADVPPPQKIFGFLVWE